MIAKKSLALDPPSLQRLLLRIQKYTYTIVYKSTKELTVPDMLSMAPFSETNEEIEKEINLHIHLVRSTLPAPEFKLNEIRQATNNNNNNNNHNNNNNNNNMYVCMYLKFTLQPKAELRKLQ